MMSGAINLSEENDINYANFLERVRLELERSKRYKRGFSVCLISVGGSKEFLAVDHKPIIKDLTKLIIEVARIPDIVVSCSSDELALIMPETPLPGAFTAADRIRKKISGQAFSVGGNELQLSVNMGIAAYPDHAGDPEALAAAARQAMELSASREPNSISSFAELSEQ
jgi:two-component system, cell cycle response regulator